MKINYRDLSTKELATFCQRVLNVSDEAAFTVVKDNPLLVALHTVYTDYDAVYVKKTYSGKSEELAVADQKRDVPFAGLKNIVLGYTKLSMSAHCEAAKAIYAIIQKHGIGLDRYKYAEESAQLKKLLEELNLPTNSEKLAQMQLTDIVDEIATAQDNFEKLFAEVAGENSELRMMESATSMRKTLEQALRNYLNVVSAMNSLPGWKELYAKLDELAKSIQR